ncbi:MAG TPA: EamA family transporter [Candidatus Limnocylindria bacterium]|nr:EamA family transporter [Candidatus Limnocylindria bacterium]
MRAPRANVHAPEWQVWLALGIVYVVWGSTYLAIRVMVETMPPLLSGGVRHLVAGTVIFSILALRRGPGALRLTRAEWLSGGLIGLALLLGGNGLVVLGERDVPSGLAALIVAVVPLCVVVLRRIFGERVPLGTLIGVVAGFAGVAVLIIPEGINGTVDVLAMLMIVGASISWSVGTYFSKRVALPKDPLASTGTQMLTGGTALVLVGFLTGEAALVQPQNFSTASLLSLAYLIVFGSVLAYTAYTWVLIHASVSRVSTYAYVNPVVALALGALLLNENIDTTMLIGAAIIVVSVWLVIRAEARRSTPAAAPPVESDLEEGVPIAPIA